LIGAIALRFHPLSQARSLNHRPDPSMNQDLSTQMILMDRGRLEAIEVRHQTAKFQPAPSPELDFGQF